MKWGVCLANLMESQKNCKDQLVFVEVVSKDQPDSDQVLRLVISIFLYIIKFYRSGSLSVWQKFVACVSCSYVTPFSSYILSMPRYFIESKQFFFNCASLDALILACNPDVIQSSNNLKYSRCTSIYISTVSLREIFGVSLDSVADLLPPYPALAVSI